MAEDFELVGRMALVEKRYEDALKAFEACSVEDQYILAAAPLGLKFPIATRLV